MRILFPLLTLLLSGLCLQAQDMRFFPQIGDGALAGLQVQTTLLFVNTGPETLVTVDFFDSQGQPLVLTADGISGTQRVIELAGGEGLSLQTSGQGNAQDSLALGYARLQAPESVEASAVFSVREKAGGTLLVEASVAAVHPQESFSIFFDSSGALDTGLAMVVTDGPGGTLTLTLRDAQGQALAERQIEIASGERMAAFVTELLRDEVPGIGEMRGSLTVESQAGPLAAVTLRQIAGVRFPQGVPTLTTFPVAPAIVSFQAPRR
ncbi:MAG TPA: hypothetical protein VLV83_14835 [Acidobacteriota bacterium]|nr:hypothetical protein [Acidobacteriota bacterium]